MEPNKNSGTEFVPPTNLLMSESFKIPRFSLTPNSQTGIMENYLISGNNKTMDYEYDDEAYSSVSQSTSPTPIFQPIPVTVAPEAGRYIITSVGTFIPTNCPNCKDGHLIETVTPCGVLWGICCFPCGIYCLFKRKDKKCGRCGYYKAA